MNFLSIELDKMLEEYEALDMEWRMLAEEPFSPDNLNEITSMQTKLRVLSVMIVEQLIADNNAGLYDSPVVSSDDLVV
ncbi:hypothetical protein [Cardiobacterium hominis]|jgi:hypothetical protein|uniref:Uncharacterized protein n=1 Tax=Inoviridae sp. ct0MH15 TaxID=2825775 RepID=A0A8S5VFH0_9VIRU|nr:hypothetical protein [Cardiobacterium hominis]DAG05506.1 MAG TPA: hypothetical protein [Inoviridae sp. ct0MH15]